MNSSVGNPENSNQPVNPIDALEILKGGEIFDTYENMPSKICRRFSFAKSIGVVFRIDFSSRMRSSQSSTGCTVARPQHSKTPDWCYMQCICIAQILQNPGIATYPLCSDKLSYPFGQQLFSGILTSLSPDTGMIRSYALIYRKPLLMFKNAPDHWT